MAKRNSLLAGLEDAAQDPTVRAVAASAALAAGGVITGTTVRHRVAARRRKEARRYRLGEKETAANGVRRIARGQLQLATELVRGDASGDRAEAVHEARKTIKRLRALLRLSRDSLGDANYRRENVVLREVGRSLSGARDAEVLLETLDALAGRFADDVPAGSWSRFRQALETEQREARTAQDDEQAREAAGVLSETELRVPTWPLPVEQPSDALAPGFERIYRRGRRALRRARQEPSSENLHELRKRAKDLWHASQLMRQVSPKRLARIGREAHKLSDLLGDDHDLAVLLDRARSQPELFTAGELELLGALAERRSAVLTRKALRRAKRLYRRKPRKLLRQIALG